MTIVYGMKSRDAFYVSIMELSKLFLFVESQATYNKFDDDWLIDSYPHL